MKYFRRDSGVYAELKNTGGKEDPGYPLNKGTKNEQKNRRLKNAGRE